MIQSAITNEVNAKYSENLLPVFSSFNENYTGWNITSGTGVVENTTSFSFANNRSLRVTIMDDATPLNFNSNNDGFKFTAPKTGQYIICIPIYKEDSYSANSLSCRFVGLVNSISIPDILFYFNDTDTNFEHDKWNLIFQVFNLVEGDEFDLTFYADTDTIGTRFYIGQLKVELDDRNLVLPSRYTFPLNTIIENTVDVTIPEILTGETAFVSATLTGALVGDYVQMVLPTDLASVELSVSIPMVTAPNTIRLAFTNNSGATIAEIIGASFKFKIVR